MPADGRWDLTRRLKGYTITVSCTCTSTDSAFTLSLKLDQKVFFLWSLRTMPVLSRSCTASAFSWRWSLPPCFCANLWISLDTTSTCSFLWKSLFLMYQGALTVYLSTLFWNRCIMSILLCLVPHFMEPEDSLPRSQVTATYPYPEPARTSSWLHNPLPKDTS